MNTIHVKYFASVREQLGLAQETIQTAAITVQALRAELIARGGPYAEALAHGRAVRVAVNQVMALDDTSLPDQAEVAFFPPVTGG
jgi:sulfur-carrier protein